MASCFFALEAASSNLGADGTSEIAQEMPEENEEEVCRFGRYLAGSETNPLHSLLQPMSWASGVFRKNNWTKES